MAWSQAKRPFRLTTPLGEDVLLLTEWEGEEHISSFYRFTVTAFSENASITASDLLLKKVSLALRLPDGSDRTIHGVVSHLSQGGTAPVGHVAYQIEIVPPHWVLGLDEGFDIFQSKSARDVAEQLLTGTPHEWKLTRTLSPRPYCFRYRESRWHCIARLLEQEGIWYRYDNKGGEAKLVLCDSVASAQTAWGVSKLQYNPNNRLQDRLGTLRVDSAPYVSQTRVRTANEFLANKNVGDFTASSGSFTPPSDVKAYRFEQQISAHRTGIGHGGAVTASDIAKLPEDAKVYSRLRQELAEAGSVMYVGESRYAGLEVGAKTEVVDHPNAALNKSLFIIGVRHHGSNGSYEAGDAEAAMYRNSFEAIPAATPYRPAMRTSWPHVGGAHVGVVTGPSGEEIYTDKHGRVQVVFKWDLEDSTSLEHSCWIRVAQSFAGQQFGAVWLPRIGHEVIVEFLDGNPDNPVVVGSLYNSSNMPPWALPENKTQSGVKTHSTLNGGADNFNQMRFEDKKGEEHINVQAEKDLITLVKNDETRTVGHNRLTTIHNEDKKIVEEADDITTVKKGDQYVTIETGNRTVKVKTDHTVEVEGQEKITVSLDRTVEVDGNQKSLVKLDKSLEVKGKQTRIIKDDDLTEVKEGASLLTVKQGDVGTIADQGNIVVTAKAGTITMKAEQAIILKVGESKITISQDGIKIKGAMVSIEGQTMVKVKGGMTQINGDSMVMIKGGITMIN